ncbi:MAG: FkbM family methyltransferase, partial [Candidatus Paceibacterota bacterium]
MPFILRDGTSDLNIFRSINESQFNEYRLPEKFEAEDIIIDIGLHIGSFSYACATKGAGRVLGFE